MSISKSMKLEELRIEFAKPICICKACPSYPKEGAAFCRAGKSEKEIQKEYCICYRCWVYRSDGLKGEFFCAEGKAREDFWEEIKKKEKDIK
jgi:hypothetical protein